MLFQKHTLTIAAVLLVGALTAFAAQKSKTAAHKDQIVQGSVVASTDDLLTLRTGKKDMSFKISSTTEKPTPITPGSNVTVNYHDEGNQHIASSIHLAPTPSNATAAKPPARK
jgi:hypothetical protein